MSWKSCLDNNLIKTMAIKFAMELNEKKKSEKKIREYKKLSEGLIAVYEIARKNEEYPYDVLKIRLKNL